MACVTNRLNTLKNDFFLTGAKSLGLTVLGVAKATAFMLTAGCIDTSCSMNLNVRNSFNEFKINAGDLTSVVPNTLLKIFNTDHCGPYSRRELSINQLANNLKIYLPAHDTTPMSRLEVKASNFRKADNFLKKHLFSRCVMFAQLIVDTITHIADFIIGALALVPALLTAGKVDRLNARVNNGWRAPGFMIADIFKGITQIINPDLIDNTQIYGCVD